jgi:hypothetical protein
MELTNSALDLVAYCQGRTLLSKTNFWVTNIASMAVEEECVKHAMLALAGAYVLDYLPSTQLLARTNNHYQQAVSLITGALSSTEMRTSNRRDCIVSALSLLIVDDVSSRVSSHPIANTNTRKSVSIGSYGVRALRCRIGI